uniref:Fatty acyl-CoA reductase n=1 Tax=Cacopsylla melanoneura TaxID=428564 RepID=A0A8D9F2C6_9HEMI
MPPSKISSHLFLKMAEELASDNDKTNGNNKKKLDMNIETIDIDVGTVSPIQECFKISNIEADKVSRIQECFKNSNDEDAKVFKSSPIQEFYKDQTVFITGATGFIGMLLVEKLLRCCPQIRKLILLVRNRKSKSVSERVREYFSDPLFDTMRLANPRYYEKIDIVTGQLETEHFGLSPTDLQALLSNTSIIFHVAATVRFDEHIRTAYNINVVGTNTMISLAKQMTHLKSFVHVSTAYSHCDKWSIDETFYSPTFTANELSIVTQNATDEQLAILNEHLIGSKPNTYTLTKDTAEDLVREAVSELPICVFRPSVVFPTLEEPMPFWMKGVNSVLAIVLAIGIGLYRVYLGNPNVSVDIVPADRVINAMVALAWYQTIPSEDKRQQGDQNRGQPTSTHENKQTIFNFVSYNDNRVMINELNQKVYSTWVESEEASTMVVWKSNYQVTSSPFLYTILFYVLHFVPAVVFSLAERLTNQKPQVLKFYRKVKHLTQVIAYFSLNEWQFENQNVHSMINAMSQEDRTMFDASMNNFSWGTMLEGDLHRCIGLYMVNEQPTKETYKTMKMVYINWADYILKIIIKGVSLYLILYITAQMINIFLKVLG